ncbi:hypothetical protein HK096_003920 [Nowakowskiella sp. JEL0078]|nr:hypothetical protein HK096_003920 [Nowakowskiella sp. JEL0078]
MSEADNPEFFAEIFPRSPPQYSTFGNHTRTPLDHVRPAARLLNSFEVLEEDDSVDSEALLQLLVYAGVKFAACTFASPLIVANVLQQVQYKPSDEYIKKYTIDNLKSTIFNNEKEPELENDRYSSDDSDSPLTDFTEVDISNLEKPKIETPMAIKSLAADSSGYLKRTSFDHSDPTTPPFQIEPLEGSSLSAVQQIIKHQSEGFMSLFKGAFTGWMSDMTFMMLQPSVEGLINDLLELRDEDIPLIFLEHWGGQLATSVASHSLTGFLLSPLELARTRLITQTSNPYHKKYKSTVHCLSSVISEEGGFMNMYFGRHFSANLAHYFFTPLFKECAPLIIERGLSLSNEDNPLMFGVCEFLLGVLELTVMVPVDTVRRRLYCQVVKDGIMSRDGSTRNFETVVERSTVPYRGMLDCMYRMVVEEGGTRSKRKTRGGKKKEKRYTWKLGPLFKGFRARLFALVVLQGLKTFTDIDLNEI